MTRPKPDLYSPANAARFKDAGVVSAYAFRPPYAQEAIEFLAGKALDSPHRVLDVGCGPGDIARRLAPRVASIDAVDFSVGMVEVGRRLPGGDAPNLHWIVSSVESAALEPAYALITAGESLHWFDWGPRHAAICQAALAERDHRHCQSRLGGASSGA